MPLGDAVLPAFGRTVGSHSIDWNNQQLGRWRD